MLAYSVVLPTYKEVENLKILIPHLLKMFEGTKRKGEIIVVDDLSCDGTREFLNQLKKNDQPVRLIERRKERGVASAIRCGTDKAQYAHIIHMDSDLAHTVDDLKRLLNKYEKEKGGVVVVGSRYLSGSAFRGKPFLNRLASLVGGLIIRHFLKLSLGDVSNNFRVFPKKVWQAIRSQLTLEGNIMLVQELILMKKAGYHFIELPITYLERRLGESKLGVWKETKNFFKALPRLWRNTYD